MPEEFDPERHCAECGDRGSVFVVGAGECVGFCDAHDSRAEAIAMRLCRHETEDENP